jgi:UDP-glucose 4-epimerase
VAKRALSLDQLDLFVHGRVVDTTRLVAEFGFQPRSTAEAFGEFIAAQRPGALLGPEVIRAAEQTILDLRSGSAGSPDLRSGSAGTPEQIRQVRGERA